MTALVYPISIEQGVPWTRDLHLLADATTDFDLTGYTARGQIRAGFGQGETVAAEMSCEITTASDGEMTVSLTAAQTAALTGAKYVYDVVLVGPSPSTAAAIRLMQGSVSVSPRVTRV